MATLTGSWDCVQSPPAYHHQSRSRIQGEKTTIEVIRDRLTSDAVFYDTDAFNLSWLPTLRALWSPLGQPVMIPTPSSPKRWYGIGAVNYWTGETVVLFRPRKRRAEGAQLLQTLLDRHPTQTMDIAWDNASSHRGAEIAEVVQAAQGRLVLLYLPTYSPWLNPIEMRWRHLRRVVTHNEFFLSLNQLVEAATACFADCNQHPHQTLSIIGSYSA